eukprot:TRINITY_DN30939_c0_g1_i3.p1 TRINITY_DN30939_c0_g1~~TRINITY_DN30939_c0_g1_i3.p1  ORF type:complete len:188 (+),score=29.73 TRINITY_DN30939_c0_g1_i3:647-1210(+)
MRSGVLSLSVEWRKKGEGDWNPRPVSCIALRQLFTKEEDASNTTNVVNAKSMSDDEKRRAKAAEKKAQEVVVAQRGERAQEALFGLVAGLAERARAAATVNLVPSWQPQVQPQVQPPVAAPVATPVAVAQHPIVQEVDDDPMQMDDVLAGTGGLSLHSLRPSSVPLICEPSLPVADLCSTSTWLNLE